MEDPFGYCEQLVRDADKDRFLATLFAPARCRGPLAALYAFNVETARVREVIREPMAGEIRLQWWRQALENSGSGEAMGSPIASALLDTIARFDLPVAPLVAMIEARAFDLYNDPMPTLAALEGYATATSSALIDLAARILGGPAIDVASAVRDAGQAYAVTALLRAFPRHASRGQLYLPLEILERHGAPPEDVFAGRTTAALLAALAELRAIAERHLEAFAKAAIPPAAAPAFLPVAVVRLYLRALERFRREPFRVVEVPQWRRQWALWRAAPRR